MKINENIIEMFPIWDENDYNAINEIQIRKRWQLLGYYWFMASRAKDDVEFSHYRSKIWITQTRIEESLLKTKEDDES